MDIIPRRIIQTWKEKRVPSHLKYNQKEWKRLCNNNDLEYIFLNILLIYKDLSIAIFIKLFIKS